jgi:hypothetical protein
MRWIAAALCSYEVAAVTTRRMPTLTQLCRRHPWLAPVLIGSLTVHLYRHPGGIR